ncbi:MAG TPA: HPr(Ser) kinase/phosphatase, partial [Polyangiaceae bacterium]|nr:HPr(Ser) kinase/phosphatase [Polyangiaceae bacterium]
IRERKRLDLVVELEQGEQEYDRLGLEDATREILGVQVRKVCVPVRPGRNMSSIIEIAARNELLRQAGHHPAREFVERVEKGLLRPEEPEERMHRSPSGSFRFITPTPNESSAPPPVISPERR